MHTAARLNCWMENTRARISGSACPYEPRWPLKLAKKRARRLPETALLLGVALTAAACGSFGKQAERDPLGDRGVSAVERSATAPALTQHLDAIQKLLAAEPATQAELLDNARRDAEASRLASARLRHALLLATSGHAGFDPVADRKSVV